LYHAAAVLASGHTVALFDLAAELLARCGVVPALARQALSPLTQSTLLNLLNAPTTARALTGPFARGDASVVRRHLVALAALADHTALRVYALLGARALRLAQQRGPDARASKELTRALKQAALAPREPSR